MKYVVDVPDNKVEAFLKIMDGLRKGEVIQSVQVKEAEDPAKSETTSQDRSAGNEKTAYDFVEQYRDLVD